MSRTAALLALLLALAPQPGRGADALPGPPDLTAAPADVVLDFVARDSEGELVLDLKPEEVEIYEDGVLQGVEALQLVRKDAPDDGATVLALVFDRLGRDSRGKAIDAATKWVRLPAAPGRQVGVFRIGEGLEMRQSFTADSVAVADALEDVLGAASESDEAETDHQRLRALLKEQTSHAEDDLARSMELGRVRAAAALGRDQPGLPTANALLALVNGLRVAPGRKAVVVFTDGLALADFERPALRTVAAEANRGGVSFYAVDASGRGFAYDQDLGTLTADTGGFLVSNRNEIPAGLRRVEEELGTYYSLSYAPANETWDGGFRKVDVQVGRPGLELRDRHGYFAVRTATPTPVLEHEAPVLAALDRTPDAGEIPLRVSALEFPDSDGDTVVALMADLPAGGPSLQRAEGDLSTWTQDFTVVAVVRREGGQIVHKVSHRYVLSWGEENLDDVEIRRVLFGREALLPPGRYTVEVMVRDAQSGGLGVARRPLDLEAVGDDELRVSSLMIVGHAEPRTASDPSPLFFEGDQLYPNLGDPVSRDPSQPLAFLFTLRPGERALAAATVELMQGDKSVVQSSIALPTPDASGQMRVVRGLQLDELEPGRYILRLRVNNAQGFQTRSTLFTLGP